MIHRPDTSPWQPATARPVDWRDSGLCLTAPDPNLWHAVGNDGGGAQADEAKRICWKCPVRATCARHALERPERWGVWGGLTQNQRALLLGDTPPYDPDAPKTALPVKTETGEKTGSGRPRGPIEHGTHRGASAHRNRGEERCGPCDEALREYRREYRKRRAAEQKAVA